MRHLFRAQLAVQTLSLSVGVCALVHGVTAHGTLAHGDYLYVVCSPLIIIGLPFFVWRGIKK